MSGKGNDMIKSRQELREYLKEDYKVNNQPKNSALTWKYLKCLRFAEYHHNVEGTLHECISKIYRWRLRRLKIQTGFEIPMNTFGKGLGLHHCGTIIVNSSAEFGDYCVVQADVVISANVRGGDYVYCAPGVKINNDISIASHVILGMNAVVVKNITDSSTTWGGVPAKKISDKGFYG